MSPRACPPSLLVCGILCLLVLLPDQVTVWIDRTGHTYLTDSRDPPVPGAAALAPAELAQSWGGKVTGPAIEQDRASSRAGDRVTRELRAAAEDIARGEEERGLGRLRRLQQDNPTRPEVGLALARAERRRGRLESAREALDAALGVAAEMPREARRSALRLRRELDEEIEFSKQSGGGERELLGGPHFRLSVDHAFAGRAFAARVLEALEQARQRVARVLGRTLDRPLEVRLYTRADYLEAYRHRFGFATVGFYDGAIHVVSARHPRQPLYALLIHEYVHAVFADALGGHRPFFLNEGIADREEERARGRPRVSRGEWRRLLEAERGGRWIPLVSLVESFSGVEGEDALLAYLESRAAVETLEEERPGAIARWLARCARGEPWEAALRAETGWDTADLEAELRAAARSRFPDVRLPAGPAPADPGRGGAGPGEDRDGSVAPGV